ncbi:unnamed protein product [Closterium sp. NIES-54]
MEGAPSSVGSAGASPRLSPQQLCEWLVRRARLWSGATGAGGAGAAGAGGGGVSAGAGVPGGTSATGPGGARTRGTGAAGTGGVGGAGAGDPAESGAARAGGSGAGGAGAGGAGAGGAGAVDPGGTVRPPTVSHLLATSVIDPSFESVAELLDSTTACRLDFATALVAESASASPPSVGGEFALGTDVLEDRQEDFEFLAAALAMDDEMASSKSIGTYVDEVPRPGANIVDGMWIFRVKRPPGSPPAFKARYVARGFSVSAAADGSAIEPPFVVGSKWSLRRPVYGLRQVSREWHNTVRTTLAALGFAPSTADPSLFLCTDTSLPPFYILVYVDNLVFATADTEALTLVKSELQKRHTCTDLGELCSYLGLQITRDRAQCTITLTQLHMVHQVLQRFGFQFSSPQPTPLSTSHSLLAPPSDEFVEPSGPYPELVGYLMYLMTCTRPDLAYPLSLLACYVAPGRHRKVHWDVAKRVLRYLCRTSSMGCLTYLMTCTRPDLAYPLSILACYVPPGRHRPEQWEGAKRVLRYLCSTSGMGLVLGGQGPAVLTSHADASWVDDSTTQRSSQGYTFSLDSGSVSWRSTRSS